MLYEENYLQICVFTNLIIINNHNIATVEYSVPQNLVFKRKEKPFNLVSWTMSDVAARVLCSIKSTFFEASIYWRTLSDTASTGRPIGSSTQTCWCDHLDSSKFVGNKY